MQYNYRSVLPATQASRASSPSQGRLTVINRLAGLYHLPIACSKRCDVHCLEKGHSKSHSTKVCKCPPQNWPKLGMYIVYHKLSVLQENWRLSLYGF